MHALLISLYLSIIAIVLSVFIYIAVIGFSQLFDFLGAYLTFIILFVFIAIMGLAGYANLPSMLKSLKK